MTEAKNGSEAVIKGSERWMELFKKHEWKELANLYSPDCKVFPPGMDVAMGRDGCARVWKTVHKMGAERIVLEGVKTEEGEGGTAADHSNYLMYDVNGKEIDHGKYVVVWRKIDNKWYLHFDIFNSDVPKPSTLKGELAAATACWEATYRSHDFKSLSELYTPNCKVYAPGQGVAEGRRECQLVWEGAFKAGADKILIKNDETVDMGSSMAADRSHYWMYDSRDNEIDHGKYVVVWRKIDGRWYLHHDIFNSNRE